MAVGNRIQLQAYKLMSFKMAISHEDHFAISVKFDTFYHIFSLNEIWVIFFSASSMCVLKLSATNFSCELLLTKKTRNL